MTGCVGQSGDGCEALTWHGHRKDKCVSGGIRLNASRSRQEMLIMPSKAAVFSPGAVHTLPASCVQQRY